MVFIFIGIILSILSVVIPIASKNSKRMRALRIYSLFWITQMVSPLIFLGVYLYIPISILSICMISIIISLIYLFLYVFFIKKTKNQILVLLLIDHFVFIIGAQIAIGGVFLNFSAIN